MNNAIYILVLITFTTNVWLLFDAHDLKTRLEVVIETNKQRSEEEAIKQLNISKEAVNELKLYVMSKNPQAFMQDDMDDTVKGIITKLEKEF